MPDTVLVTEYRKRKDKTSSLSSWSSQSSGGRQALVDTQNMNINWDECQQRKVQINKGDLISIEE